MFAAHRLFKLNAILSFWIAYILTRPLGASLGDYLSQAKADGGLGLGTTVTSFIFLAAILAHGRLPDRHQARPDRADPAGRPRLGRTGCAGPRRRQQDGGDAGPDRRGPRPGVAGRAAFFLLVPNPDDHLVFDRNSQDVHIGAQVMALAMPLLQEAAGGPVEGRVASSPNAYDDIVEELNSGSYDEIILSTLPTHVSHWLHLDLPRRIADLGYPVQTVTASHPAGGRPHVPGTLDGPGSDAVTSASWWRCVAHRPAVVPPRQATWRAPRRARRSAVGVAACAASVAAIGSPSGARRVDGGDTGEGFVHREDHHGDRASSPATAAV